MYRCYGNKTMCTGVMAIRQCVQVLWPYKAKSMSLVSSTANSVSRLNTVIHRYCSLVRVHINTEMPLYTEAQSGGIAPE